VPIPPLSESELLLQAQHGDLRPQFDPHAVITWAAPQGDGAFDRQAVLSVLLNRFFELGRPIADACREPGLGMRLGDAGRFCYLIAALEQLGYQRVEENLLVFLDEFAQLELASYDELYLWSIVELSRRHPEHVETFWPMVLTLDLRFRASPWKRPAEISLADLAEHPYRLTELVMYFYVLGTTGRRRTDELAPRSLRLPDEMFLERFRQARGRDPEPDDWQGVNFRHVMKRRYPSLLTCLRRLLPLLNEEQIALVKDVLWELVRLDRQSRLANRLEGKSAFSDAHGILQKEWP
jgi:hypothetical protein